MRSFIRAIVLATAIGVPLVPGVSGQASESTPVAIRAGALFDGTSESLDRGVTILVEAGRISAVGTDVSVPASTEVIDLSEWTVLPGLIDLHTHITLDPSDFSTDRGAFLFRYREYPALRGAANARTTLLAGFTTIRDLGSPGTNALALRDAIEMGHVPGPRIVVGIQTGVVGGHCDRSTGILPGTADVDAMRLYNFDAGAEEAAAAVRRAVRDGADLIKICATAGVLSLTEEIGPAQMTPEEIEAVVSTASMLNRRVAAHAHGLEGIGNAVRGGVTTIEHGSVLDDAVVREMAERGTWLIPTLTAFEGVTEMAEAGVLPPGPTRKALEITPYVLDSHRRAVRAGVRIAFGTDSGVFEHGINAREFELMVEIGLTPAQSLLAATARAAEVLDRTEDLGTIQVGRLADIVAVRGNPLDDISVMRHVGFVMKGGTVYVRNGVPQG